MLNFYYDAGHGWLRVPKYIADALPEFKPSQYSYHDDRFYYLEEDCDAPAFLKLCPVPSGIKEIDHGDRSCIREKYRCK